MFPDELVTIPRDDTSLTSVGQSETILRRFDPDNGHVADATSVDEGQEPRIRLKGGALTGFSQDGCSTGRDEILIAAGIDRKEMLEPKHRRIAAASAEAIRAFAFTRDNGDDVTPFDVIADAYPSLEPNPKRWMVAHSLVIITPLNKSEKTAAVGALARTVFEIVPEPDSLGSR